MSTNTTTNENASGTSGAKMLGIFLLAWFVPGMGHIIQKKYLKGFVFLFGTLILLTCGVIMEGKFYDTKQFHPLMILGFLGDLGNGLFYFLIKLLGWGTGRIEAITFNYGTTYMVCAGLLNYLVALNAVDIVNGRRK